VTSIVALRAPPGQSAIPYGRIFVQVDADGTLSVPLYMVPVMRAAGCTGGPADSIDVAASLAAADEVERTYWLASGLADAPPPKPTPREWLERLPSDRQQSIVDTMIGNPGAGRLWIVRALGAAVVDVADPETIAGVENMATAGVISADEAALLLAP
jgi:hypothetical protein